MIAPSTFFHWLYDKGIDFFTGIPDSLLKDICAFITDNSEPGKHIIAANEGNAVGIASGYHLASGKIPLVYLQNSGLGNIINPLLSLTDKNVYSIPMLLMIGWRGEPGVSDEPQHITQGALTLPLLEIMGIPYEILSSEEAQAELQVEKVLQFIKTSSISAALVIRKGVFEKYTIKTKISSPYSLTREEAIKNIVDFSTSDDVFVSTTGKTSRELFEYRAEKKQAHHRDFLTVGSMGHTSQIALGIALAQPNQRVICLDGDGSVLMHMGGLAIIGQTKPKNLLHIVINNGAHESVGGQPTVAFSLNLPFIARSCGYTSSFSVETSQELQDVLNNISINDYPVFIEVKVKVGSRENLGRPTIKPIDNKHHFMQFLRQK
ncbi:MAG TPA: phosphonopyruvate decarboxylase [Salinivirgaceae bacterium]|nr:phosphonopyruvate decarboxylase [Salinivirgaceae bacterium]